MILMRVVDICRRRRLSWAVFRSSCLSPVRLCLTLGVWMLLWISAFGAAPSDSHWWVTTYLLSCPKAQRWCFASALGFQGQPPFVGRSSGSTQLLYQVALGTQRGQVGSLSSQVWLSGRVRRDHAGWSKLPPQVFAPPSLLFLLQPFLSPFLSHLFTKFYFIPALGGWFTLLKSKKNKVAFFFLLWETQSPFMRKSILINLDSL